MVFVGILSQIKLLFGPLFIQLVQEIINLLACVVYTKTIIFTSVSVKVMDIYFAAAARQISTTIHLHFGE